MCVIITDNAQMYLTTSCFQIIYAWHDTWVLHLLFPGTIMYGWLQYIILLYVPCPILSSNCMSRPKTIADPINGSISGLICGSDVLLSTTPVPVCMVKLYHSIWHKKLIISSYTIIQVSKRHPVLILTQQLSSMQ